MGWSALPPRASGVPLARRGGSLTPGNRTANRRDPKACAAAQPPSPDRGEIDTPPPKDWEGDTETSTTYPNAGRAGTDLRLDRPSAGHGDGCSPHHVQAACLVQRGLGIKPGHGTHALLLPYGVDNELGLQTRIGRYQPPFHAGQLGSGESGRGCHGRAPSAALLVGRVNGATPTSALVEWRHSGDEEGELLGHIDPDKVALGYIGLTVGIGEDRINNLADTA